MSSHQLLRREAIHHLALPSIFFYQFHFYIMKTGQKKLSKEDIQEIVRLRSEKHYSLTVLARMFKRDHTTILYHCQRAGLTNQPLRFTLTEYKREHYIVRHPQKEEKPLSFYEEILKKQIGRQKFLSDRLKERAVNLAILSYRRLQHHPTLLYETTDFQC